MFPENTYFNKNERMSLRYEIQRQLVRLVKSQSTQWSLSHARILQSEDSDQAMQNRIYYSTSFHGVAHMCCQCLSREESYYNSQGQINKMVNDDIL